MRTQNQNEKGLKKKVGCRKTETEADPPTARVGRHGVKPELGADLGWGWAGPIPDQKPG
jgi:hypothetical protein